MTPSDLGEVNLLLSKAFTHNEIQKGNRDKRVPLCRQEFLECYLEASRDGAFVLADKSRLVGFSFSRLWGRVGWIGPLGVRPSHEGKGFGTELVKTLVQSLQSRGARRIGLEMTADSCRNLAFYSRLGFQIECTTLDLMRSVETHASRPANSIHASSLSELWRTKSLMEELSAFHRQFDDGLDYRFELEVCLRREFGNGLVFRENGRIIAFALAHTAVYSTEEQRQFLKVNILQILDDKPITILDTVLYHLDRWAMEEGLKMLYLRVPVLRKDAIQCFLSRGFRIVKNDLRLVLDGFGPGNSAGWLNLSKWE